MKKRVLVGILAGLVVIGLSFIILSQSTLTGFSVYQTSSVNEGNLEELKIKENVECLQNSQCSEGFECVDGECVEEDKIDNCEEVKLYSGSRKLKQGDTLNSIKSVFTDGQLPYLLADGEIIEIIDNNLVEYFYVQIIFIGENVIERENESYIVKGDFFTYKLIFSKAVDFSNKNIHGQVLIILGKEYVIDSSSDNSKIVLVSDNKKIRLENGKKAKTKKGLFFRDVEGNLVNLIKGEDGKIISIEIEFSNINGNLNIGDSFSEDVFDKSQGNALDKIKDADEYKTTEGKINHSAF